MSGAGLIYINFVQVSVALREPLPANKHWPDIYTEMGDNSWYLFDFTMGRGSIPSTEPNYDILQYDTPSKMAVVNKRIFRHNHRTLQVFSF